MLTIGLLPSPLKIAYLRFRGAKIGRRVKIGLFSVIDAKSIDIGDDCSIGPLSFLKLREELHLGKRVAIKMMVAVDSGSLTVGNDTTIMEQVIVGGMLTPRSRLSIGKRVKIFPHSFINPTYEITIEDDVGIGGSNYIFTHGSWQSVLDGYMTTFAPVHIKKNAWLPWRVFIMPGTTIGENAILGSGSVVGKSVPDGGVASGVRAEVVDHKGRHIRKLSNPYRFKIVANILSEFRDYETWLGRSCQTLDQTDTAITLEHSGRRIGFRMGGINPQEFNRGDIAVSLEPISQETKSALDGSGIFWIDLLGKETRHTSDPLATDLKTFFSRYGIRFEILD